MGTRSSAGAFTYSGSCPDTSVLPPTLLPFSSTMTFEAPAWAAPIAAPMPAAPAPAMTKSHSSSTTSVESSGAV